MQGKAIPGMERQDNSRQGNSRQGNSRQDQARPGQARPGKARQGKARQGKARQGKAGQGRVLFIHKELKGSLGRKGIKMRFSSRRYLSCLNTNLRLCPLFRDSSAGSTYEP